VIACSHASRAIRLIRSPTTTRLRFALRKLRPTKAGSKPACAGARGLATVESSAAPALADSRCRALVRWRPDDLDPVFVRYLGQASLIDRTWRRYGELKCLFADLGHEVRER